MIIVHNIIISFTIYYMVFTFTESQKLIYNRKKDIGIVYEMINVHH